MDAAFAVDDGARQGVDGHGRHLALTELDGVAYLRSYEFRRFPWHWLFIFE